MIRLIPPPVQDLGNSADATLMALLRECLSRLTSGYFYIATRRIDVAPLLENQLQEAFVEALQSYGLTSKELQPASYAIYVISKDVVPAPVFGGESIGQACLLVIWWIYSTVRLRGNISQSHKALVEFIHNELAEKDILPTEIDEQALVELTDSRLTTCYQQPQNLWEEGPECDGLHFIFHRQTRKYELFNVSTPESMTGYNMSTKTEQSLERGRALWLSIDKVLPPIPREEEITNKKPA